MSDQAELLRKRISQLNNHGPQAKTIAVISGKGGVGKSNISLNFSLALSSYDKKVLLFDMDIGMGNIDILMGQSSQYTIVDLFDKGLAIEDVIKKGHGNIHYISGGTGLTNMFKLDGVKIDKFLDQLQFISNEYDYIIFDMGAGLTEENLQFLLSVDEIFIITTPEPTSIMDAYSAIKYLSVVENKIPLFLLVNRAQSDNEGNSTLKRLTHAIQQFLNKDTIQLGVIPDDKNLVKAVNNQVPVLYYAPKSEVSKSIEQVAERYITKNTYIEKNSVPFISKLRKVFGR